jgi:hypothetical protein
MDYESNFEPRYGRYQAAAKRQPHPSAECCRGTDSLASAKQGPPFHAFCRYPCVLSDPVTVKKAPHEMSELEKVLMVGCLTCSIREWS